MVQKNRRCTVFILTTLLFAFFFNPKLDRLLEHSSINVPLRLVLSLYEQLPVKANRIVHDIGGVVR